MQALNGISFMGLITSTALVISNDAPTAVKVAARLAKVVFGNRIQICDGTDDQVEIQAAIDALPAGGGKVILLEGTFTLAASISIPSNLSLIGSGWGNTVLTGAGVSMSEAVPGVASTKVVLSDFYCDFSGLGAGSGMDLQLEDFVIEKLYLYGAPAINLLLRECNRGIVRDIISTHAGDDNIGIGVNSTKIEVSDCITHSSTGGAGSSGIEIDDGATEINVVNCTSYGNGNGFEIHNHADTDGPTKITFTNCYAYGNSSVGFSVTDFPGLTPPGNIAFSNCIAEANGLKGFNIQNPDVYEVTLTNCYALDTSTESGFYIRGKNHTVSNCHAIGNATYGFHLLTNNLTMTGCIARNNQHSGAYFAGVDNIHVSASIFINNYQAGTGPIEIQNGAYSVANYITFVNCDFSDDQGTPTQRNGLMIYSGTQVNVIGCRATNNTWYGFYFQVNVDVARDNYLVGNGVKGIYAHTGVVEDWYNQYSDLFMDVLAEDADHVVAAEDLTAATPITCTLAAQPDVPRNVTITITDGDVSITAFQITVNGVDAKGHSVSEVFTEAGGLSQVGNIAFATISSITVDSITGAGAGDVLDVGIGSKLGLSNIVYVTGDVYKVKKDNIVV